MPGSIGAGEGVCQALQVIERRLREQLSGEHKQSFQRQDRTALHSPHRRLPFPCRADSSLEAIASTAAEVALVCQGVHSNQPHIAWTPGAFVHPTTEPIRASLLMKIYL